jgi:fluoroquinolone resistance protein
MKLMGTEFTKSIVKECSFAEADLTSASLKECDLAGTVFNNTILDKADFSGASNYQIDIRTNRLKRAKFTLPEAIALLEMLDIEIE